MGHLEGATGVFIQQYGRKANPSTDPNDRRYDRKVEERVELLHGSGDEDLNKDAAIRALLAGLRKALGPASFMVVDHWQADPCAVGVAHPRNQRVLAHLALSGTPGRYDVHLELPAPDGSDPPYRPAGEYANVGFNELAEIVRGHLRRSA